MLENSDGEGTFHGHGTSINQNECCIHCTDSNDELIELKKKETWEKIRAAGVIRNHVLLENTFDQSEFLPLLRYHRKCYQRFTLKRDLNKVKKEKEEMDASIAQAIRNSENNDEESVESMQKRRKNSKSHLLPKECLFCKKRKVKRGITESLTLCIDERAENSIKSAAKKNKDFNILGISDLIAAETHYHKSCYKQYLKVNYKEVQIQPSTATSTYSQTEKEAYKEVIKYCIQMQLGTEIVPLSFLLGMVKDRLAEANKEMAFSYRKNFRRKLENNIKEVNIVNVEGDYYVYPRNISIEKLIPEIVKLKKELKVLKDKYENKTVAEINLVNSVKMVKEEILKLNDEMPWPPQPSDLEPEKFHVTPSLDLMLHTLLKNKDGSLHPNADRLKLSFAQDIVYAVTKGRVKTPKSILLPSIIKTLTNNTEIINMVNRLGHGISYTLLMEIQTENAYMMLDQQREGGYILPLDCKKQAFSIYVADNIDRNEETLSGHGTTHKVNNLLIQVNGNFPATQVHCIPPNKRKRRSFKPPDTPDPFIPSFSGKRIGPEPLQFPENGEKEMLFADRQLDNFIWVLLRLQSIPKQIVPSWTGFNVIIHEGTPVMKSSIQYLDCLDCPATEKSTIYQVLCRALSIMDNLQLDSIVCVFDQAIYCKACEIKWREPGKFQNCVLMMGMFHMLMSYMQILYKRFAGGGLKDALIQSAVVAEGSAETALRGKCYNRGIRIYKLFYEALQRLLIEKLFEKTEQTISDLFEGVQNEGLLFQKHVYNQVSESPDFQAFFNRYLDLKTARQESEFQLSKFWLSYIEMIELLLNTIYACRSGKWDLLLQCVCDVIPFAFAYDHINYARYLTVFLGDMLSLEVHFPDVYRQCVSGNFTAQLSDGIFSRVETDKVIEMTLNKDTKTPGGTTGFSTNIGAVKRWETNASYRAALRSVFHKHLNYSSQSQQHKDLSPSRIAKDEKDIQAILAVLCNSFVDPFSEQPLLSISTGLVIDATAANEILTAKAYGLNSMSRFINERLSEGSVKSIFDPIKKQNLPTFEKLGKKKVIKTKNKIVSLETSKELFSKVAIIAQKRAVDLKRLFQYPLVHLPLSLAEADGTLKKTAKSLLLHKIEGDVEPVEMIRENHTFIADGMAFVRQIKTPGLTYRQFATKLLQYIMKSGGFASRIDVVFDVYLENCIKDVERARRSSGELMMKQIVPTSDIKQWNQLLSSGDFKNKLVTFIVDEWKQQRETLDGKTLFVTDNTQTFKLTSRSVENVDELQSNQQEADTRMLLHAKHASLTYENVIIASPDTDVFIIALSKLDEIDTNLFMLTGVGDKRRIIDLNAVAESAFNRFVTVDCSQAMFLNALLGFHAFTGCDTTSAFARRGKIKPLLLLGKCLQYIEGFSRLGTSLNLDEIRLDILHSFTCHMYGKKDAYTQDVSINDLRYSIYCQKVGKVSCDALPPCWNALKQHIKRANYQTRIWRMCLEANGEIAGPEGNGWLIHDGKIDLHWMTCSPAPEEVLELISCSCRMCHQNCPCITNELPCTDACGCSNCGNTVTDEEISDDNDENSDDDSDSDDSDF